jgi:hypothetical protein
MNFFRFSTPLPTQETHIHTHSLDSRAFFLSHVSYLLSCLLLDQGTGCVYQGLSHSQIVRSSRPDDPLPNRAESQACTIPILPTYLTLVSGQCADLQSNAFPLGNSLPDLASCRAPLPPPSFTFPSFIPFSVFSEPASLPYTLGTLDRK